MKKLLKLLLVVITLAFLSVGYLVGVRWMKNPEQIVPYPYDFAATAISIKLDAPILIIGDRMGAYFGRFKEELAATISQNLDNVIKVQSLAADGYGLHRTLHQLKSIQQWPQIVIYQGGSEEFSERKFEISENRIISKNFDLYRDDRIHTALILYPWLSRLVYTPTKRTHLPAEPILATDIKEREYLARLETELLLFEEQLNQLVAISRDRNALLILTTTPINLDAAPKSVCSFTSNVDLEARTLELKELMKNLNWKRAWQKVSKLTGQYPGNSELFFLQGQIAKNIGKIPEGVNSMLQASSYECASWRMTEVQNSIIRKVANTQQVLLFDFSRMVEKEWATNVTFFDDLHPQNIYYEKGMTQLGLVIKRILKL